MSERSPGCTAQSLAEKPFLRRGRDGKLLELTILGLLYSYTQEASVFENMKNKIDRSQRVVGLWVQVSRGLRKSKLDGIMNMN